MEILSNIPIALINNIGFMSILFLMYELVKGTGKFKPAQLFVFTVIIQITSLIQFIFAILLPNKFNIFNFYTGLHSFVLSNTILPIHQWLFIIGIIYCTILVFFLVKMAYQFVQLNKLKSSANFSYSDKYKNFLPINRMNAFSNVKIGMSNQIDSPITFGWLTPIILLPIAICNQLSTEEIETIILHEIAHIIRKDYLVNLIISVNQIILFFNPFSYFLNKELCLYREIACDLIVIQKKPQKLIYMNALLKIAEHVQYQKQKNIHFTLGIFGTKSELLQRIQYFNNIHSSSFKNVIYKLTFGLTILAILFSTLVPSKNAIIKNSSVRNNSISKNKHFTATLSNHSSFKVSKLKVVNRTVKQKHSFDLNKASYANLVDQTMLWIKKHEPTAKFASYQDGMNNNDTYEIADKLLITTIFSNYKLKRDVLNQKLAKTNSLKEALDYLLESEEFEQIKQYEKWTKEFLQTHSVQKDTSIIKEPIIY